jgi:hypothetical protein
MDKGIRLSIIPLDEAKAFAAVEKFYGASGLLSGKFPARRTATFFAGASCTVRYFDEIAFDLDVRSRNLAAAVYQRKTQGLTFCEPFQASAFHLADMDKNIFSAAILHDEAEALLRIEEFYGSGAFADNLVGHATPSSGTAGITVRSCVSFHGRAAVTLISIEVFVAETIALVPASTSPVSVKTHS